MAQKTTKKRSTTKKSTSSNIKTTSRKTTKPTPKTKREPKLIQEENSYGRTIVAAILIIAICVGGYFAVQHNKNKNADANYVQTADEKQFKEMHCHFTVFCARCFVHGNRRFSGFCR